jgi:hypothetical protein
MEHLELCCHNLVRAVWKVMAFIIPSRSRKVKDGLIFPKERLLCDLTGEADDLWRLYTEMTDASQNTGCKNHRNVKSFKYLQYA